MLPLTYHDAGDTGAGVCLGNPTQFYVIGHRLVMLHVELNTCRFGPGLGLLNMNKHGRFGHGLCFLSCVCPASDPQKETHTPHSDSYRRVCFSAVTRRC